MLHCQRYLTSTGAIEDIQPEQVAALLEQPDIVVWVDLYRPTEDELQWLMDTFRFHPLAIEDIRKQKQRAKVDRYETYYYFVLRSIHYHVHSHRLDSGEIDIFIGKNYLVTSRTTRVPALDKARELWVKSQLPHEATPFLFYLVVDAIVDSYFPVIDNIGELIDDIDATIFSSVHDVSLQPIFALRKNLLKIRKILGPLRDALDELIRAEETGIILSVEHTRAYFMDVLDHVLRITDFVDTFRDMLSGSLDAYQSAMANKLNENMQRLTIAATILATAAALTGFFGMNLQGLMVNSGYPYGAYIALALLIVSIGFELWIFRKKGWW
ncbi:MAG: magnesium/cobalt transporter CorA [Armatimonadota bacterium]